MKKDWKKKESAKRSSIRTEKNINAATTRCSGSPRVRMQQSGSVEWKKWRRTGELQRILYAATLLPIGRVSFESFMRFAPIGGRGGKEAFYSREERFAFLRRGRGKVTCKGPARALLARHKKPNGGRRGEHLPCQYSPMIRSPDISPRNEVWKTLSTWKISREIFNWNGWGVCTALR